jgi:hypothetical protein
VEDIAMKIHCTEFDNLLLEGDAYSMDIAEKHAATCAACSETLTSWKEISQTARGMQTTWQTDMLWPRIERSIRAEKKRMPPWMTIAASFAIFAIVGVMAWTAVVRVKANRFEKMIIASGKIDAVREAEKKHREAIAALEEQTEDALEDPASPLLVSYKEKLMLLDDAIAQCETAIQQNRRNAHLRKQLLAMYSEKQRTLQEVLREETSNVSNQ